MVSLPNAAAAYGRCVAAVISAALSQFDIGGERRAERLLGWAEVSVPSLPSGFVNWERA